MRTSTSPIKSDTLVWEVNAQEIRDSPRWDADFLDPAMLEMQRLVTKCAGKPFHKLADVRAPGSVRKSHDKGAFAAIGVRDVEPAFIGPHVPRYVLRPPKNNWVVAGDIIVTKTGTYGIAAPILDLPAFWEVLANLYTVEGRQSSRSTSITSDILAARVRQQTLSPAIVAAYLSSPVGRVLIRRTVYGTGGKHLRRDDLKALHVPNKLRDLDERINDLLAGFYETLLNLMSTGRQLVGPRDIRRAEHISARSAYDAPASSARWDFGWAVFRELNAIAEALGFQRLSEHFDVFAPGAPAKADRGYLVCGTRDVKPHMMLPRGEKPRVVDSLKRSNWARTGDVLIAAVGGELSTGTTALVLSEGIPFIQRLGFSALDGCVAVSGDYLTLRARDGAPADRENMRRAAEATLFLNSPLGRLQIINLAVTTKQTRVRQYELGEIRAPFGLRWSVLDEYRTLASILNDIRTLVDRDIPTHLGIDPDLATAIGRPYINNLKPIPRAMRPRTVERLLPLTD